MIKNQKTIADLCLFWGLMFLALSLFFLVYENHEKSDHIKLLEKKIEQHELDIEELFLRSKFLFETTR